MTALPMFLCNCVTMSLARTLAKEDALSKNPVSFEESYGHFKKYMLKVIREKCDKPRIRPLPNECVFCGVNTTKKDLINWLWKNSESVLKLTRQRPAKEAPDGVDHVERLRFANRNVHLKKRF